MNDIYVRIEDVIKIKKLQLIVGVRRNRFNSVIVRSIGKMMLENVQLRTLLLKEKLYISDTRRNLRLLKVTRDVKFHKKSPERNASLISHSVKVHLFSHNYKARAHEVLHLQKKGLHSITR